jgi:hypothetical protein
MADPLATVKDLYRLLEKYNDGPLMKVIVDLRDEVFHLSEENRDLKLRVRELEEQQAVTIRLKREGNHYYHIDEEGNRSGPYCMPCWDGDRKLMNLPLHEFTTRAGHYAGNCERCRQLRGQSR